VVIAQILDSGRPAAHIRRIAADLGLRKHGSHTHQAILSRELSSLAWRQR
jgi:hypothetical protein